MKLRHRKSAHHHTAGRMELGFGSVCSALHLGQAQHVQMLGDYSVLGTESHRHQLCAVTITTTKANGTSGALHSTSA